MSRRVYRYTFSKEVDPDRAEESLLMAVYAAEGIHGAARVRLEVGYLLDRKTRTCIVEASTPVGETVAQVFTSYLSREFGEDSFQIDPVDAQTDGPSPAGAPRAEASR